MRYPWIVTGIFLAATPAMAQFPPGFQPPAVPPLPGPVVQVSESLDSVIRSAGQSNMRPSMAAVDRETARSMSYDNQVKATRTFFEKRKINRIAKAEEEDARFARSKVVGERNAAKRTRVVAIAREMQPEPLDARQYDPSTGKITWPVALKGAAYGEYRGRLDELFAEHVSAGGGINTPQYADIQASISAMEAAMQKNIKNINPQQYTYARNFIQSLSYQAKQTG